MCFSVFVSATALNCCRSKQLEMRQSHGTFKCVCVCVCVFGVGGGRGWAGEEKINLQECQFLNNIFLESLTILFRNFDLCFKTLLGYEIFYYFCVKLPTFYVNSFDNCISIPLIIHLQIWTLLFKVSTCLIKMSPNFSKLKLFYLKISTFLQEGLTTLS